MFAHFFMTNVLINIDHGAIPAAVYEIKRDLGIGQTEIGLLGSLVYVGLTFGSVVSGWVFNILNAKYVISIALLCNIGALVMFPLFDNFYLLALSRILVGVFQVFSCIYIPVWIDHFAPKTSKTMMLTLV